MGPFRTGFVHGLVAVVVTVVIGLRYLYLDPSETPDWVLSVFETFLPLLVIATHYFLGILAAIRVRPVRLEPGVPYRSILLRDCALAASVVAVIVGAVLLLVTALQATVFADGIREYVHTAAPKIASYVNETGSGLREPPPPTSAAQIEHNLQPPRLGDLGKSLFNLVLRAIVIGFLGALVGLLRGYLGGRAEQSVADPAQSDVG